jgi:hypothetical protein
VGMDQAESRFFENAGTAHHESTVGTDLEASARRQRRGPQPAAAGYCAVRSDISYEWKRTRWTVS